MSIKYDVILNRIRKADISVYDKGKYINEAAINVALPVGQLGWICFNYETDTFWAWDADTNQWVDTDRKGQVESVFGRTGIITSQSGDYNASQIDFNNADGSIIANNVHDALDELSWQPINVNSNVDLAVAHKVYYVDTSTSEITIKLPNVTEDNDGRRYRFYKIQDVNDLIITTVSGVQLVGGFVNQVLNETDTGITLQANYETGTYEIIQDSRSKSPTASITFYSTTQSSGISTYLIHVASTTDSRYNTVAVDSQHTISSVGQLLNVFISDAGVIRGIIPETNITTSGQIRRDSGTGTAQFYVEYYKRTAAGVETLLGSSSKTPNVTNVLYAEFNASGIIETTTFEATDRFVTKLYADRTGGGVDPQYSIQVGGTSPARSVVPIPSGSISHDVLANVQTAADSILNGHIYMFNKSFSSSNSTGFSWTDNTLTVTHNLDNTNPFIQLKDNNNNSNIFYNITIIDENSLSISFPVAQVPITGSWNIKII